MSIHKEKHVRKCDPALQTIQNRTTSEITIAMTLVTVVLLREVNYIAYP